MAAVRGLCSFNNVLQSNTAVRHDRVSVKPHDPVMFGSVEHVQHHKNFIPGNDVFGHHDIIVLVHRVVMHFGILGIKLH